MDHERLRFLRELPLDIKKRLVEIYSSDNHTTDQVVPFDEQEVPGEVPFLTKPDVTTIQTWIQEKGRKKKIAIAAGVATGVVGIAAGVATGIVIYNKHHKK